MTIQRLERIACRLREDVLVMLAEAGSGHTAGALGMADIYAALYFEVLRHRPQEPAWPERDRLVLSCGHTVPIRYAAMAASGYFPRSELLTLRKIDSRLQGHPHRLDLPGLETSSGPLGQGLSQAIGMALAARMEHASWRTYAILSDGEHDEGQTWEAVLYAGSRRLAGLTAIVDRNRIQIGGGTETVMPLDSLADKYRSFNWDVVELDGQDIAGFIGACRQAAANLDRPTCIIADTVPGKGVDFMEGDYRWHGKTPTWEEADKGILQLESSLAGERGGR